MPTGIEDLWKAMDQDIASGKSDTHGWMLRLTRPAAGFPLFVAIELASRRRAILLRLPLETIPSRRRWPRCKGLEPLALKIEGKEHFGIALKDVRFADVFTALAEDLTRRVAEITIPSEQTSAFLGQLSRWQKFLTASLEGLNEERQRGLWGELSFLRDRLLPVIGTIAVPSWKGPDRAHQDFQFGNGAIEVKTTLAKQPQVVRITSERQLDSTTWPTLILFVIALEVRGNGGETLPVMISSIRSMLAADTAVSEQFDDALLLAGYLDAHAVRYADHGYVIRSETVLHVRRGFPRLIERDMPTGVCDVNYGLAIASCSAFEMTNASLKTALAEMMKPSIKHRDRKND